MSKILYFGSESNKVSGNKKGQGLSCTRGRGYQDWCVMTSFTGGKRYEGSYRGQNSLVGRIVNGTTLLEQRIRF